MEFNKEIEKIIEYQNASLLIQEKKSETALKAVIDGVKNDYENGNYDFSRFTDIVIKQIGKDRHIKTYSPFSCEEILCIYLKRVLDKKFHIRYPNRNEYVHSLFDIVSALHNMSDYSIFRFDFEDFFNSVSTEYVFKKYISNSSLERYQIELFEKFVLEAKYAYAGLNTSNIFCEIIAKRFDEILKLKFRNHGLIFYRRYIDDGILIFNKRVGNDQCLSIIKEAIKEVFYDNAAMVNSKCKTRLNAGKTKYISAYDLAMLNHSDSFDFLGYEFVLSPSFASGSSQIKTTFKYGITQKKIDKYSKRIDNIIDEYKSSGDIELLRHQLKAFCFRTVYQISKYKSLIWKTKGFIANYQELRYRMDLLTVDTEDFLKNSIQRAFTNKGLPLPYFLTGKQEESIYNLYNNMLNYRTLLFVEPIGINRKGLDRLCSQIGISNASKSYDGLVRDYLIKVKVGH